MTTLRVLLDGEPMPAEDGVAFWKRFSAWMEEHPSDLAGFARSEGLSSVHPEMHAGAPVLVASKSAPQKAYTSAPKKAEKAGPQPGGGGGARTGGGGGRGSGAAAGGSRAVHPGGPRNGGGPRKRAR